MSKFTFLLWVLFASLISHAYGFRHGVESSSFDRAHANEKLQNCMEVIYDR